MMLLWVWLSVYNRCVCAYASMCLCICINSSVHMHQFVCAYAPMCLCLCVCIEWCTVGGGCYCLGGLGCVAQYTHAMLHGLHAPHCAASESDFGLCPLSLARLLVTHSRTNLFIRDISNYCMLEWQPLGTVLLHACCL